MARRAYSLARTRKSSRTVGEDSAWLLAGMIRLLSVAATKLARFGSHQGVMPSLAEILGTRRIDILVLRIRFWSASVRELGKSLMAAA
jgi:hypothetical protein